MINLRNCNNQSLICNCYTQEKKLFEIIKDKNSKPTILKSFMKSAPRTLLWRGTLNVSTSCLSSMSISSSNRVPSSSTCRRCRSAWEIGKEVENGVTCSRTAATHAQLEESQGIAPSTKRRRRWIWWTQTALEKSGEPERKKMKSI